MFDLKTQVYNFIKKEQLFDKKHQLLVAVSGGVDSMVLLHVLLNLKYNVSVAHVNFMLRGKESKRDEIFVKKICKKLNIQLHLKQIEIINSRKKNKTSIQQEARQKRYEWFYQLMLDFNYNYLCTAHHADDLAETMLINFTRGTGIEGLIGIKSLNEKIVRPLLVIEKSQIIDYANQNKIKFVTDSSNLSLKYTRNKIRHKVVPILKQINPDFIQTALRNSRIINAQLYYYKQHINSIADKIVFSKENRIEINSEVLLKLNYPAEILFEYINNFGFNYNQSEEIIQCVQNQKTGVVFNSSTHQLLVNRKHILLEPKTVDNTTTFEQKIFEDTKIVISNHYQFEIEYIHKNDLESYQKNCLYLDKDKLTFPLIITPVFKGAKFSPLGIKGSKKVSDYLIDKKINLFDKNNALLLLNSNKVAALLPYQTDNSFKITESTNAIMVIKTKKAEK